MLQLLLLSLEPLLSLLNRLVVGARVVKAIFFALTLHGACGASVLGCHF
jgi:hypothetical protein